MKIATHKVATHAVNTIQNSSDDPEDAIMISLTQRETSLVSFGMICVSLMYPELRRYVDPFSKKIMELGIAQDKFGDREDLHMEKFEDEEM